jgi:hypothetical protein
MPETSYPLSKPSLAYAKLVATPTDTSWSQVYNAGNLFACVSLTIETPGDEERSLPAIGKEILDTLHSEFFVLDKKNIASISEVIQKSIIHVPESTAADISLGFFKDNILYLFLVGHGRVIMKRQGKIGKLLESKEAHNEIITASGYLHNEDTVVLETKQFADDTTDAELAAALDLALPNDIAEALSPQMHEKADGGQAAIIVVYHGVSGGVVEDEETDDETQNEMHSDNIAPVYNRNDPEIDDEEEDEEEEDEPRRKMQFKLPAFGFLGSLKSKFHAPGRFKLNHTRKLFLSITIILILLLVGSIFFTKKKEADAKLQQQFQQVYEPAQQKYESAKALETLNKDHSYDDYLAAKKLLADNSSKFPSGSSERKQIDELLTKVDAALASVSPSQSANAKEATVPANSLLAVEKANSDGRGFTQDEKSVYFVTDKAIAAVSKSSGKKADLIKNSGGWDDAAGLATYQGNFYVLDRKKGIVKFIASGDGYSQASYFKDKPNVSSAKDLAIDSSVYILLSDGTILKYTSGTPDAYKSPTLEKPISGPAKIFTDKDTSSIYILDRGNSRVIKLAKEGGTHSEYNSSVIKTARDFEVNEKDKKIYILSDNKIFEISL